MSPMFWYGPAFRWFAWHPVDTKDRGWRWLRLVWRRRSYHNLDFVHGGRFWDYSVQPWKDTR